jgi:hypothetical protein
MSINYCFLRVYETLFAFSQLECICYLWPEKEKESTFVLSKSRLFRLKKIFSGSLQSQEESKFCIRGIRHAQVNKLSLEELVEDMANKIRGRERNSMTRICLITLPNKL